jgi:rRNA maturation protein Nop10
MITGHKFYCQECDTYTNDETCRWCGEEAEELCVECGEILDNCNCVEVSQDNPIPAA